MFYSSEHMSTMLINRFHVNKKKLIIRIFYKHNNRLVMINASCAKTYFHFEMGINIKTSGLENIKFLWTQKGHKARF